MPIEARKPKNGSADLNSGKQITATLTKRNALNREIKLLQGNQAIAAGAVYAGARFYAGYPSPPLQK